MTICLKSQGVYVSVSCFAHYRATFVILFLAHDWWSQTLEPAKCPHLPKKCSTRTQCNSQKQKDRQKELKNTEPAAQSSQSAAQPQAPVAAQESQPPSEVQKASEPEPEPAAQSSQSAAQPQAPVTAQEQHNSQSQSRRPSIPANIVVSTPTSRKTRTTQHQLFGTPSPPPCPRTATTTHQQGTRAYFWFNGYTTMRGIQHRSMCHNS